MSNRNRRGLFWMSHIVGWTAARLPTTGYSGGTFKTADPTFSTIFGADKPGRRVYTVVGLLFRDAPTGTNTVIVRDVEGNEVCRAVVPNTVAVNQLLTLPRHATFGTNQVDPGAASVESSLIGVPIYDGFTVEQSDSGCHLETLFAFDVEGAR